MGINLPYYKTLSFVLCSVFASIAGFLLIFKVGFIAPSGFNLITSIDILLFVVLGGLGSFTGSVFAAAVVYFLRDKLGDFDGLNEHRELIFSIILVLSIRFIPNGFFGLKEIPSIFPWLKKKFFNKKSEVQS